ncbi:hypothetical protein DSM109990_01384 [Sulfitobacter dubius]|uniref:Uncharacterized protein n=1 Tax=Sulfitobacter dubius TaxID=218673 RepID=A0ABY3ZJ46_9RHOB|nr:hypothetical protein DSM109990_01384 [Sulfitobacter dubius]
MPPAKTDPNFCAQITYFARWFWIEFTEGFEVRGFTQSVVRE